MGVFSKREVPSAVQLELQARSTKKGMQWSAKRFPWIHITSLSSICKGYKTLSSTKTTALYEADYIRPLPVVTGVSVKKQGELGTTRKATINLTAFSDEQLVDLQTCYFIPGVGCRVEWGWSVDAANDAKSLGSLNLALNKTDAEVTAAIRAKTETETHYDGLQGIVANFKYGLNKDNFWDCTIEVIAAAEAFSKSSVAVQSSNCSKCAREFASEDGGKEQVEKRSLLYTFLVDLFKDFDVAKAQYQAPLNAVASIDGKTTCISKRTYDAPARDENGAEDGDWLDKVSEDDAVEPYISWPTLEAAVTLFAIPKNTNGEYSIGRVSSPSDTVISYHPKLLSSDPRVCVIAGPQADYANRTCPWEEGDQPSLQPGMLLEHIHVNVVYLLGVLKRLEKSDPDTMSIHSFLMDVLNRINEVCGGLWNFEVVNQTDKNTTKGPVVAVIDAKHYETSTVFLVPATPGDSVVRDLKLDMKMTDSMKSHALYSNGVQQNTKTDAGGGCGTNAFEPFGLNKAESYNMPKASVEPPCLCEGGSSEAVDEPDFNEWVIQLSDYVDENTTTGVRNALVKAYAEDAKTGNDKHCKGMILPFEFSFTVDGIGGFAFGQMVSCNRIPEAVRSRYEWQVTTVEHDITANDWSTTINTVCRYK